MSKNKTIEEERDEKLDAILRDNFVNLNRIHDNESDITTIQSDVDKLKQEYFTGGNGIIITDNRKFGMDTVDISIDPINLIDPRIDVLEQQVHKLEETNKALAQYIYDEQKKHHKKSQNTSKPIGVQVKRRS